MNRVELSGRLTKDIELRKTGTGKSVVSFTVATKEKEAQFINCVAWNQSADYMSQYGHKGDNVIVAGRIQTRSYDQDGQKKYVTEIIADSVELIGKREDEWNTKEMPW